ncbi:MAG: hypothetical protein K8T91_05455 [Planctomycetes bacterium]|nr:hypothetical protein [Planctomycetota bacterium]
MSKPAWIRWTLTQSDTISDQDLAELKKSIVELIGAEKWPAGTTSIRCVGKQLIIRQTPAVHEQILRLLKELEVLEQEQNAKPVGGSNVVGFLGR